MIPIHGVDERVFYDTRSKRIAFVYFLSCLAQTLRGGRIVRVREPPSRIVEAHVRVLGEMGNLIAREAFLFELAAEALFHAIDIE